LYAISTGAIKAGVKYERGHYWLVIMQGTMQFCLSF